MFPLRTIVCSTMVLLVGIVGANAQDAPKSQDLPTGLQQVLDSTVAKPAPTQTKALLNVAVLPFTGSGTSSESDLAGITSRFEAELMRQGFARVLERRNIDAILREQGFQQSGACNTSQCQVEVGQLLGVDRIITGEVSRSGKLWSMTVRMVDVGSGALVRSHVLDIKGSFETVLRGGCPEMAEILSGKKLPPESRTVLAEEKSNTWIWILGGAVIAGGGAATAFLLLDTKDESAQKETQYRDVTLTW